jgi:DNA-binding response OmpR family regulator
MPSSLILVVDDEPVITQTLVTILNKFGDEFIAIGSTRIAEALTIVRGIHPDLVLLDAVMPGSTGLDQALEMREKYGCKVLMMSGQIATGELLDKLIRGGHEPLEILAKPVHPMELITKIRELLSQEQTPIWQNPLSFHVH